jgi:hypothetical protein
MSNPASSKAILTSADAWGMVVIACLIALALFVVAFNITIHQNDGRQTYFLDFNSKGHTHSCSIVIEKNGLITRVDEAKIYGCKLKEIGNGF